MSDGSVNIRPIGHIETCYPEKFGVPRQSGLVPAARGRIIFTPDVPADACRGLEDFSHIWLFFLFDQVSESETRWFVRPPRLGGNTKLGVFATRSPFRPNRLGLSLVRLERVKNHQLEVSGLDLVHGTPIFDLKPYLPYVEALPGAAGGFANQAPIPLNVTFINDLQTSLPAPLLALITQTLAIDPRPAYHQDPQRIYTCLIEHTQVSWRATDDGIQVLSCVSASA